MNRGLATGFGALLSLASASAVECARAQETRAQETTANEIEEVRVVGARLPRLLQDVAGSVSVVDAARMEQMLIDDLHGIADEVPGMSVFGGDTRFSDGAIRLRGIGGNRVHTLVDGVPLPQNFAVGAFANSGQDLLALPLLQRVEVLRGPASSLFGSDALGGVVAFFTKDPEDLLANGTDAYSVQLRGAHRAADQSTGYYAAGAAVSDDRGLLVAAHRQQFHESDHSRQGISDPQDGTKHGALLKLTQQLDHAARVSLTAEHFERSVNTEVRSLLGSGRRFRNSTALRGDDEQRGTRTVLRYEASPGNWLDQVDVRAHWSHSDTSQHTDETRAIARPPVALTRNFRFEQQQYGAAADLASSMEWLGVPQRFGYGVEFAVADIKERRDGSERNLTTGAVSTVVLGEAFPVRDFPLSTTREFGAYLFNELTFGPINVIPGVRYDYYQLRSRSDAIYRDDNSVVPVDLSHSSATPRLALVANPSDEWTVYAQYSRGYRAPPVEDVNIGLDLPLLGVRAISNPDLKAERSASVEAGTRYHNAATDTRIELSAFHIKLDDFIASKVNLGPDQLGTTLFQSQNIERARIRGAQLAFSQGLDAWLLDGHLAWTQGDDESRDEPLNSIDPAQARLRLTYRSPSQRFDSSLVAAFSARKDRLDTSRLDLFETPQFTVLDWLAGYRWQTGNGKQIAVRAAVFNLLDRAYWRSERVGERAPDDPTLPALSEPGRHLALSLDVQL